MNEYRITAIETNNETGETITVDNLLAEKIEAENKAEAIANYAEYFADQCRNSSNDADVDNDTDEVTVNGMTYTFSATEI